MRSSPLELRLAKLRETQNPDGGWGYFPKRQSWLEPTAYASLALAGEPASDGAWKLISSWQNEDGSMRPAAQVTVPSWGAALFVIVAAARNQTGEPVQRATQWMLGITGAESSLRNRLAARIGLVSPERDVSLQGWPWKPGNSAWVEPTAHSVLALQKSRVKAGDRISLGQSLLMDLRCKDGGWNYGSKAALGIDLASYPETTGIALMGLQGRTGLDKSLDRATAMLEETKAPMARAWLTIALRAHGAKLTVPRSGTLPPDLQAVALEALAASEESYKFLKAENS